MARWSPQRFSYCTAVPRFLSTMQIPINTFPFPLTDFNLFNLIMFHSDYVTFRVKRCRFIQFLQPLVGNVMLKDVSFAYPMRRHHVVLNKLSLSATFGHTVALVGPSGCGKSTVIQLLERFYDVTAGVLVSLFPCKVNCYWEFRLNSFN